MVKVISQLIKDVALSDIFQVEQRFSAAHITKVQIPAMVRQ